MHWPKCAEKEVIIVIDPENEINDCGREIPKFIEGYGKSIPYRLIPREIKTGRSCEKVFTYTKTKSKLAAGIEEAIEGCGLRSGMTISFHHHLRDGDYIINMVMQAIANMGIRDLTVVSSSLLKIHAPIVSHVKNGVVTGIRTSGIRGELAKEISYNNILNKPVIFQTHGGRARSIETGEIEIDVAFLGASACDAMGNMSGRTGKSAFGSMGYAIVDAAHAKKVVAITDNLQPYPLPDPSIDQTFVDYVVVVDEIGDPSQIATGSNRITTNTKELLIAEYAAKALQESGYVKNGFSFQAGSGGSSLAVIGFLKQYMRENNIRGSFVSGGITSVLVELLGEGYFNTLLDAQTFDNNAAQSLVMNSNHIEMSASMYANPYNKGCVAHMLDAVILSATEVDVNFNINVLTGSNGVIMGAQGGHPDIAEGAKLTIITIPLVRKNLPIIVDSVTTVVTPGHCVDMVVTDYGMAINPGRKDLLEIFKGSLLPVMPIEELKRQAEIIVGKPDTPSFGKEIVGVVEARDGSVMDIIRRVKG